MQVIESLPGLTKGLGVMNLAFRNRGEAPIPVVGPPSAVAVSPKLKTTLA